MLGFLGCFFEPLHGHAVALHIHPRGRLELGQEVLNDLRIEVLATQKRVAIGGFHDKHTLVELKNRDVEGSTAEVEHSDALMFFLAHAVCQGSGGGLVDDAQNIESSDSARVLCGLALGVIEVSGHRDDRLRNLFPEIRFTNALHLLKNHRADLCRRIRPAFDTDPSVTVFRADDLVRNKRYGVGGLGGFESSSD